MLSSGSSKYPIDLLKAAGVDMTTSAPFNAAMKEMNRIMDEIEAHPQQAGRGEGGEEVGRETRNARREMLDARR